jgi:hypothetical protein
VDIPLGSAKRVALFKSLARFRKRGIRLEVGSSGIAVGDFITRRAAPAAIFVHACAACGHGRLSRGRATRARCRR